MVRKGDRTDDHDFFFSSLSLRRLGRLLPDIQPVELSPARSAALRSYGGQEGGGAGRREGRTVRGKKTEKTKLPEIQYQPLWSGLSLSLSLSRTHTHARHRYLSPSSLVNRHSRVCTLVYTHAHARTHAQTVCGQSLSHTHTAHTHTHTYTHRDVPAVSLTAGVIRAASVRMQP